MAFHLREVGQLCWRWGVRTYSSSNLATTKGSLRCPLPPVTMLQSTCDENRKSNQNCVSKTLASSLDEMNKPGLQRLFERPSMQEQATSMFFRSPHPQLEYKLPTVPTTLSYKKTILDPVAVPRLYDLPTYQSVVLEKFTPTQENRAPIIDPSPIQIVIDQGAPPLRKEVMPYLVTIRRKKMKKHKLRKHRKRMIFLNRKLREIKSKKKEKVLLERERQFASWASSFNPKEFVEEQIVQAKKGGWGIDIIAERNKTKGLQTEGH